MSDPKDEVINAEYIDPKEVKAEEMEEEDSPLDDLADLFDAVAKPMKRLGMKHGETAEGLAGDIRNVGKAAKKLEGVGTRLKKWSKAGESKRTMPPSRH